LCNIVPHSCHKIAPGFGINKPQSSGRWALGFANAKLVMPMKRNHVFSHTHTQTTK